MQALGEKAWQIGSVAAGLGFVIFVHELGHFLIAKWCGVKCEKFYVGFDVPIKIFGFQLPSKLVHFQWGETEYGVGIIPLGGYVKMLGQDDDPRAAQAEMERIRVKKSQDSDTEATDESETVPANADADRAEALREGTAAEGLTEGQSVEQSSQEEYELDPRSFPAKTVPQRMCIISAGVIMNLIFAVIFAMFAFRAGVPYTPCEVGSVVAGGPAWQADIQPGSRIIQIGEKGRRSEHLRFTWDLRNAGVGMTNHDESLLLVVRGPEGEEKTVRIKPTITNTNKGAIPTIGIAAASETMLADETIIAESSAEFQSGDVIVAIDGQSVKDSYELDAALAARPHEPVLVKVERSHVNEGGTFQTTEEEITIQPNPLRRVGLVMRAGPVVGIAPESPADAAGFQVGDLIQSIAGEPFKDPILLPSLLVPYYGQKIEVTVRRGEDEVALQVNVATPAVYEWNAGYNSPMTTESLGLAVAVEPKVLAVIPGSSAEKAKMQPDDVISAFKLIWDDPTTRAERSSNKEKPQPIGDESFSWPFVFRNIQGMKDGHSLVLSVQRNGQTLDVPLKAAPSGEFYPERGFVFAPKQDKRIAQTWSEALLLGARRTKEDASRVFMFLRKLVTGEIAITNVGGPVTIAVVAGSEASEGLPRLLIFLTFLSANLAVVNFMPIPALDGGHFIFLMWEGISGKPVNERVQIALTLAGVGCLLCLMIFVVGLDINRLFF
ncbi:MAG: site-2 protease family protein [Planctomycetes bacterium]|nr:site-2 protease family protein [Planctomycetota bacterium]